MGLSLKSKNIIPISIFLLISATATIAATTPYDLIRPSWPLSWDTTVFSTFDTTVTNNKDVLPTEKHLQTLKQAN